MKRRDLIKSGLVAAGLAAVGIVGYKENFGNNRESDKISIKPKQTDVYKITSPLPFRFELIDEMVSLNSELKKSQIKTLYNNFPYPLCSQFNEQFGMTRGTNNEIKSFRDFEKYVKYAKERGFEFVYLLNSPKPFSADVYKKHEKDLFVLLDNLLKIGCNKLKIANTQLMQMISKKRPEFILAASTTFEYHNVSQYINLINMYPNIKSINTAIDDNRNFIYLKNLKKHFPDIDIEIMVNEKCMHGCPARISHSASSFEVYQCSLIIDKLGPLKYFFKSNIIYPWQLEYYSSIGINTFKLMSYKKRGDIHNIRFLRNYLLCIEYGTKDLSVFDFFNGIFEIGLDVKNNIMLSDIISYMPDINHFIKYGDKCSDICGIDCNYCMECAKKIEKILGV